MPGLHILFAPPDLALPCALFPEEADINGLSQSTSDLQLPKGFSQWEAVAGNRRERGKREVGVFIPQLFPHPGSFGAVTAFLPERPHLLPGGYSSVLRSH